MTERIILKDHVLPDKIVINNKIFDTRLLLEYEYEGLPDDIKDAMENKVDSEWMDKRYKALDEKINTLKEWLTVSSVDKKRHVIRFSYLSPSSLSHVRNNFNGNYLYVSYHFFYVEGEVIEKRGIPGSIEVDKKKNRHRILPYSIDDFNGNTDMFIRFIACDKCLILRSESLVSVPEIELYKARYTRWKGV